MYAIVAIAGQQFKVEKGKKVIVHQLHSDVGDEVTFESVLLIDSEGKISVGAPYVKDAAVTAQVISHLRGDKIKVFKKKRRKGYQVFYGITDRRHHRNRLCEKSPQAEKGGNTQAG